MELRCMRAYQAVGQAVGAGGLVDLPTRRHHHSRGVCEPLEDRRLLSGVEAFEYQSIRNSYPEFALPTDMAQVNIIEITPDQLTVANLKGAITAAGSTTLPDLVVLRTIDTLNTITYASSADVLAINIPANQGAVSIVGLGSRPLTLDAAQTCGVIYVGGYNSTTTVNLGRLVAKGGATSGPGGGIRQYYGTLRLADSMIIGNRAQGSVGGGMSQYAGTATLTNVTITGNTASQTGGGFCQQSGTSTLTNVSISGNTAPGSSGGGLYLYDATCTLTNAAISGNTAADSGGGVSQHGGTVTLTNVAIIGNTVANYSGGGIWQPSGTSTLTNVTISGNTAPNGVGGGVDLNGFSTLNNTIVARNTSRSFPDFCAIGGYSGANNLIGDGMGVSSLVNGVAGNLVGTHANPIDPGFVSMTGTDWTKWDVRLQLGSPARDAGDNSLIPAGITVDLAGRARIVGGTVDMGAFEAGHVPAAPSSLAAEATAQSEANLTWTDNSSDETGFMVERATDSGFTQNLTLVTTTGANVTSYSDGGLAANTTYYYRVRATNAGVDSGNSNTAGPVMPLLQVSGDQGSAGQSDEIRVVRNAANSSLLDVFLNSITPTYSVNFAGLSTLVFNGLGGDDTLTLDLANGPVIPAGGIGYDGGTQTSGDNLIITGASSNQAVTFSSNQVAIGTGAVTLAGAEHCSFSGAQRLSSLTLSGGSTLSLAEGGLSTLVVQSLSVDGTSSLDVADNAIFVDYTGSNPFAGIYSLVATSAASYWAGNGIVSHTAAAGGSQYALGVADNGVANLASFGGETVDATSVLIRFTYSGDANLDGQVDLTDLSILAGSWQMAGRQWGQGDCDYSGSVDLTDLSLLASNWQKVLPAPVPAAEMVSLTSETAIVSQSVDAAPTSAEVLAEPVLVGRAPVAPPAAAATVLVAKAEGNPRRATVARPAGVSRMTAASRRSGVFSNRPLSVASALAPWPITSQDTRSLLGSDGLGLAYSEDILVRTGSSRMRR